MALASSEAGERLARSAPTRCHRWAIAALALGTTSCLGSAHPVRLPASEGPVAIVASAALPSPLTEIGRHTWFALRGDGEESWERWEVFQFRNQWQPDMGYLHRRQDGPLDGVGAGRVLLHGVLRGDEAQTFIECLRRESPKYEDRDSYWAWPGPNSNTYVDVMMRRCDFPAELPGTAIGKDFRGIVGASVTRGGTGVQIDTPLIGLAIGITEGIEVHVLGLTFGLDWWCPALKIPADDGRIGCPGTVRDP